jgi:hypothetical protein
MWAYPPQKTGSGRAIHYKSSAAYLQVSFALPKYFCGLWAFRYYPLRKLPQCVLYFSGRQKYQFSHCIG